MENSFKNFFKDVKSILPNVKIIKNKTFKNLTTIKIGGKIPAFIEIKEVSKLLKIISLCNKNKVGYFILGNGSSSIDKVAEILAEMGRDKPNNQNESVPSFEGLFDGAVFNVRSNNDIKEIAREISRELYKNERNISRGRGRVTL